MSKSPTYKLEIKSANPAGYTLNSIISAPRTSSPLDLQAACKNVELEHLIPASELASTAIQYILSEFFALAHSTGLYNRQRALWESLGRVTTVEVVRQSQGLFSKTELPFLDLFMNDNRGRTAIFGHLVEEAALESGDLFSEKKQKDHLKTLLSRADKVKNSKGPITGIFLFCPAPFPKIVLNKVLELTGGTDPVGRYESLLPEPLSVPIDLVEYGFDAQGGDEYICRLVHPDLAASSKNRTRT